MLTNCRKQTASCNYQLEHRNGPVIVCYVGL